MGLGGWGAPGKVMSLGSDMTLNLRCVLDTEWRAREDLEDGIWNSGEDIPSRRCNLGSH